MSPQFSHGVIHVTMPKGPRKGRKGREGKGREGKKEGHRPAEI